VMLSGGVAKAVITDNIVRGALRIANQSSGKVVISNNAADEAP